MRRFDWKFISPSCNIRINSLEKFNIAANLLNSRRGKGQWEQGPVSTVDEKSMRWVNTCIVLTNFLIDEINR